MILVIGGRSKIGSALIAELVLKGEAVRVLARSGEGALGGERQLAAQRCQDGDRRPRGS